ncbi:MAG TPA: hypothetical protein VGZ00_10555 [Candidatus Baltobacteraceae bacterium]|nr:hypothetical protein [Candidatus Baltobacteraceae bacterium]
MNPTIYQEFVRFRLDHLGASNAHHDFERLCFQLARKRIAPNLMEATGPVSAGGDQGRDFESYRTYLAAAIGEGSFIAKASGDYIVAACTTDKEPVSKVAEDLQKIFARGPKPKNVYYFCTEDIPVGKRHNLEDQCRVKYDAALTIFDGTNIAGMLVDEDTRWIAEQFLNIPDSIRLELPIDEKYNELKDKWISDPAPPANFADFIEISSGLRTAASSDHAAGDLTSWLDLMRPFTNLPEPKWLIQRARYEVIMAEYRGNHTLDQVLPLWNAFLEDLTSDGPIEEISDAAILLLHGINAVNLHQATINDEDLRKHVENIANKIDDYLTKQISMNDRISLLEAKFLISPLVASAESSPVDTLVTIWQETIELARRTPFSPIRHIGKVMMKLNEHYGSDIRVRRMNADVDALIAERTGEHETADRAKRRAIEHIKAGRRLAAIDEFHRVRLGYFTEETIFGAILAMLLLSQLYDELKLCYAARYYAAVALFMATEHPSDETKRLVGTAAFRLTTALFASGEGITALHSFSRALTLHNRTAHDRDDWAKHERVREEAFHTIIFRSITMALAPHLLPMVDEIIDKLPLDSERDEMKSMSEKEPWGTMSEDELRAKISEEIGPTVFADVGEQKAIVWMALGIRWTIHYDGTRASQLKALELAVTLQIVQADLAQVDLVIIPSDVEIDLALEDVAVPTVQSVPGNKGTRWKVSMPRNIVGMEAAEMALHAMSISVVVLREMSALTDDEFDAIITKHMEGGLPGRALAVRPIGEMLLFAIPETLDPDRLRAEKPVTPSDAPYLEGKEIAWRMDPGPNYSKKRADIALEKRYRYFLAAIKRTLPRLLADDRCRGLIRKMRQEGMLDWQILSVLSNLITRWQEFKIYDLPKSNDELVAATQRMNSRMQREENESDPDFDLSYLTEETLRNQKIAQPLSVLKGWDHTTRRQTPDFKAIQRLLDVRYRNSMDDIPHDDPFSNL